ncbi:hypothetical protein TSUD_284400 [Trifolium subterraneum]|uniref:Uncharacterized protein n=1 Tax=Trifolium subterraneum TaxID=3900 RepID=A0A2Z6NW75_TRISU|nr:hypothetical protein TSUD_284400 [Trifolium subterraneum]
MEDMADDPKVSSLGDGLLDTREVHSRDTTEPADSLVGVSIPPAETNTTHLYSDTEIVGTTMPMDISVMNNAHDSAGDSPLVGGVQRCST